MFADDISLFLVVHDINTSASDLNEDLEKISNWAFQWKYTLAQTLIRKLKKLDLAEWKLPDCIQLHSVIINQLDQHNWTQILRWCLIQIWAMNMILNLFFNKVNKAIDLLRKFQSIFRTHSLISIYKIFIRPHLDYGDVIYNPTFNISPLDKFAYLQSISSPSASECISG